MEWLSFLAGIVIGIVSGLVPGLHSNTVIAVLASFGLEKETIAAMIVALFPAHLVASFVPSIFFGVPSDSSIVSVLPGQRMVREGKGILALKIILVSVLLAALVSFATFTTSLSLFPVIYAIIKPYMGHLLIVFSIVLIWNSKNRFLTTAIFLLSGILGAASFKIEMYDVFLPLFSGFFSMAAILTYETGAKIEKQKDNLKIGSGIFKYILLGVSLGFLADLLPGVGAPSQIATFATVIMPINAAGYLSTISSISVSESVFSLSTSASIEKSRIGATEWLTKYVDLKVGENLTNMAILFLIAMAITAIGIYLARKAIGKIAEIDFSKLNLLIAVYLVAITLILNGPEGLAILCLSSALGYATIKLGVGRTTLMGAIIIPTILLLFKIFIF